MLLLLLSKFQLLTLVSLLHSHIKRELVVGGARGEAGEVLQWFD